MEKLNKEISVMLPRETAEEIIKRAELHDTTNTKTPFLANIEGLARAYLELEKKLSLEQQDRESEKREFKVFKDAAENEITKLKKSREGLRAALEKNSNPEAWDYDEVAREAIKADDEIMGGE